MNENMIRYRLERSREALNDAEYLLKDSRLRAAVNRLYYSMFYAVAALLETAGYSSSKHSGVRAMFNQHFIKTGIVSEDAGDLYGILYTNRHKGDYVDFTEFTPEKVNNFLEKARKHVQEIQEIVQKKIATDKQG
ncbi:MAG TPA: HEPN domain-containing protein [bacterium]|nr:HEPN domain-containing protein [bacterium]